MESFHAAFARDVFEKEFSLPRALSRHEFIGEENQQRL